MPRNRGKPKPKLRDLSGPDLTLEERKALRRAVRHDNPLVAAIVGATSVEHHLDDVLRDRLARGGETWADLTADNGLLNTFHKKIVLGHAIRLFDKNTKDKIRQAEKEEGISIKITQHLQPLTKIHLSTKTGPDNGMSDGSNPVYSYILTCIAVFILIIACINFINLAVAQSLKRSKEIGIRKVLGANAFNIVGLLSKNFLALVLIASLIAFPIAWWAMNKWLEDFPYRITISWWIFGIAIIAALLIALLTVSFQSIKAAVTNPVKSLRAE